MKTIDLIKYLYALLVTLTIAIPHCIYPNENNDYDIINLPSDFYVRLPQDSLNSGPFLNNYGNVAGYFSSDFKDGSISKYDKRLRAAFWDNKKGLKMIDLIALTNFSTSLNDNGFIAVQSYSSKRSSRAVLWNTDTNTMQTGPLVDRVGPIDNENNILLTRPSEGSGSYYIWETKENALTKKRYTPATESVWDRRHKNALGAYINSVHDHGQEDLDWYLFNEGKEYLLMPPKGKFYKQDTPHLNDNNEVVALVILDPDQKSPKYAYAIAKWKNNGKIVTLSPSLQDLIGFESGEAIKSVYIDDFNKAGQILLEVNHELFLLTPKK